MRTLQIHGELIRQLSSQPITANVILGLRRQVGDAIARRLLEIASLQSKAVRKFGEGVWMATARSLEQASDQVVATYKASLMGDRVVVDLCGGIGGDAMGFARRGAVITVDRDPQMTHMAAENLQAMRAPSAIAVCADATAYFPLPRFASSRAGLHIDPDRRPDERRTSSPAAYQPAWRDVSPMLSAAAASLVKLAPAAELDQACSTDYHRQWISYAGAVREQTILGGDCMDAAGVTPGTRSAVRLLKDGGRQLFAADVLDHSAASCERAASPLNHVFDLDPAIRAAGLSSVFAARHNLLSLGDPSGFFTADQLPAESVLMQRFTCLWAGPADTKLIRKQAIELGLHVQVVKVRGTGHDPVSFIKSLNLPQRDATRPATLLIGRNAKAIYAALGKAV